MEANYPIRFVKKKDTGGEIYWFVEIPDLPGCVSHGATLEEALESIEQAKEAWIETRQDGGYPIPDPTPTDFSGHLHLRLPKNLHCRLAVQSQDQGVSLNQYLVYLLSTASASVNPAQVHQQMGAAGVAERQGDYRGRRRTNTKGVSRTL